MVNEELTAEEWKRRYEKERDKCARLRALLQRYEAELLRWRMGLLFHILIYISRAVTYYEVCIRPTSK